MTVQDLIEGLGEAKVKLGANKKGLERLERRGSATPAPLPTVTRQRLERKAG